MERNLLPSSFGRFSLHVLGRSRTLAVLALRAARVSAPLRGGR
jgi:hypothetical protein